MFIFAVFRAQRILQLEKRIKQHTAHMHERRKMPKGTPQEEMEAARKELEVVNIFIIQPYLVLVNLFLPGLFFIISCLKVCYFFIRIELEVVNPFFIQPLLDVVIVV